MDYTKIFTEDKSQLPEKQDPPVHYVPVTNRHHVNFHLLLRESVLPEKKTAHPITNKKQKK